MKPPYKFSMELCEGFVFDSKNELSWKGSVQDSKSEWIAPSLEMGLELFNDVRSLINESLR